jgi:hypothetical protein
MNTPSHHRVHHATNARYLDRNYAGVFIVWDRMFGTFEPERHDDRPRYGIVKNLGSFNLLWAAFHEWVGIARDVWRAPGLRNKLGYMIREPGWSHDGSRETSATIRVRWQERDARSDAILTAHPHPSHPAAPGGPLPSPSGRGRERHRVSGDAEG